MDPAMMRADLVEEAINAMSEIAIQKRLTIGEARTAALSYFAAVLCSTAVSIPVALSVLDAAKEMVEQEWDHPEFAENRSKLLAIGLDRAGTVEP